MEKGGISRDQTLSIGNRLPIVEDGHSVGDLDLWGESSFLVPRFGVRRASTRCISKSD